MNWLLKLMYKYNFFIGIEKLYTLLPRYFGGGRSFHPVSLSFSGDYTCNAKCQHCLYWNDKNAPSMRKRMQNRKGEEMTRFDISSMLQQAKDIGIKTLSIHGGEPTIYRHFEWLLKEAKYFGFTINFFTNGTNLTENLVYLICCKYNVNIITFSIHGTEKVHDSISRSEGSYRKIMKALNRFERFKRAGHKIPDLRASTTIQKENQSDLYMLFKILRETLISNWTVQLPWVLDAVKDEVTDVNMVVVFDQKRQIRHVNKHFPNLKVTFSTDEAINSLTDGKTYKKMNWCPALYTRLYVNPYGDVIPCISLDAVGHTLGNVRLNTIKEIWNGNRFQSYRRNMRGNLPDLCSYCCFIDRSEILR